MKSYLPKLVSALVVVAALVVGPLTAGDAHARLKEDGKVGAIQGAYFPKKGYKYSRDYRGTFYPGSEICAEAQRKTKAGAWVRVDGEAKNCGGASDSVSGDWYIKKNAEVVDTVAIRLHVYGKKNKGRNVVLCSTKRDCLRMKPESLQPW